MKEYLGFVKNLGGGLVSVFLTFFSIYCSFTFTFRIILMQVVLEWLFLHCRYCIKFFV